MIEAMNDCVGCPQGCIGCGRDKTYFVATCDECKADITDKKIYQRDSKEYCLKCFLNAYKDEFIADMWDDFVEEYGAAWADYYEFDLDD